ncbi:hypothetical protein [Sutcliffiella halmapala]|uniref:hypothetical protein n=1 Tax=Sutcliffiella halmapala TaxID=79882 RepID=UPI0014730D02|nr:hypothetical protein [Sutcliffiella halmapala]
MDIFYYTIYTVVFIVIIYVPIFYRMNQTIRKLEDRVIELEAKWETRNVVALHKKK